MTNKFKFQSAAMTAIIFSPIHPSFITLNRSNSSIHPSIRLFSPAGRMMVCLLITVLAVKSSFRDKARRLDPNPPPSPLPPRLTSLLHHYHPVSPPSFTTTTQSHPLFPRILFLLHGAAAILWKWDKCIFISQTARLMEKLNVAILRPPSAARRPPSLLSARRAILLETVRTGW